MFWLGSGPVFCCFWLLLFALFFRWRNASLAGGFAGRRVLLVFVVVWCFDRFACSNGHMSLYKCLFCLCSCKDRAFSATSATLEEKKNRCLGPVTPRVPLLFVWHIRQQSRVGTIWKPWLCFSISIVILARGHGSG